MTTLTEALDTLHKLLTVRSMLRPDETTELAALNVITHAYFEWLDQVANQVTKPSPPAAPLKFVP